MNQILMVENKKKSKNKNRSSSSIEIRNIVMFFAIALIVFGVFLIGQGSYAIYKESKGKNREDLPVVKLSRVNDTVVVKVSSRNKIEKLKYSWNDSEETVIPIDDIYANEEIILPMENSVLNITIEDKTGRAIKYKAECVVEGLDLAKPSISIDDLDSQGNIKINATDETQMSYITYKVNEEDEVRIDRAESESTAITYILKLERGQNSLVVTAVDTSGNIETEKKTIIVSEEPKLEIVSDGIILTVTAKDTDGIKELEINLNGVIYAGKDINQKEMVLPLKLQPGNNTIKVKVTNVNGLTTEEAKEVNYE